MKNKTKKRVGLVACLSAIAILACGSFAIFSVNDFTSKTGTVGSVNVAISNLEIQNINNINPGDNDPNLPTDPEDPRTDGTSHNLTFTVANNGNKSIKTRHVITIAMEDKTSTLDPSVFMITRDNKEVVAKYFVVNGQDLTEEQFKEQNGICTAIKYVVTSDIFDGNGVALENEGNAEKEAAATVKADDTTIPEKNYTYALAMSSDATDKYQNQKVVITVDVQAMQYRNTNNKDWQTIFTDGVIVG